MASITGALRPIMSFNSVSSPSSSPYKIPLKLYRRQGLLITYECPSLRRVLNCSSSNMGPGSDSMDFSLPNATSRAPLGVTINENGTTQPSHRWRRVLLKVSGEALAGDNAQNIDPKVTMAIAREVASVIRVGIEVRLTEYTRSSTVFAYLLEVLLLWFHCHVAMIKDKKDCIREVLVPKTSKLSCLIEKL